MSSPGLSRRWLIVVAVAAAIVVVFGAGLVFGPRELVLAQPAPQAFGPREFHIPAWAQSAPQKAPGRHEPEPEVEVVSTHKYGTVSIVRIPRVEPDRGPPKGPRSADGGPPPGNYIYLYDAHRYVSLPDDVRVYRWAAFISCYPGAKCPVMPFFNLQRGAAKVGIDSMGVLYGVDEGDLEAFPFLVFDEDDDQ